MSFLGMGSGWWSVAGLILDAGGFFLLASDLLPEYRLNQSWLYLQAARLHADEIARAYGPETNEKQNLEEAAEEEGEVLRHLTRLPWMQLRMTLDGLDDSLSSYKVSEFSQATSSGNLRDYEKAIERFNECAEEEQKSISRRNRPPIRLAIAVIVIGFLLQAWGSIPI